MSFSQPPNVNRHFCLQSFGLDADPGFSLLQWREKAVGLQFDGVSLQHQFGLTRQVPFLPCGGLADD